MAERPDYEKGIALLSAPAEIIAAFDVSTNDGMGAGAPGPLTETVNLYAPTGYSARIITLEMEYPAPTTFPAGATHFYSLSVSGHTLFYDHHAQGAAVEDMGWLMGNGMEDFDTGSSAGYPIPTTYERQMPMLDRMIFDDTIPLRFYYAVSNTALLEQWQWRVREGVYQAKAVS